MEQPYPEKASLIRLGTWALVLILAWSTLLIYVVGSRLSINPVQPWRQDVVRIRRLIPQGWAFFTRDPQASRVFPFRKQGRWRSVSLGPHALPSNIFGLSMRHRAQRFEMAILVRQIPQEAWRPCDESPVACLESAPEVAVRNTFPRPTLCGDVGLIRQKPLPWSRRASSRTVIMPSTVVRLEAACD
jgi:antimicrobial peptide system SdpA family protein